MSLERMHFSIILANFFIRVNIRFDFRFYFTRLFFGRKIKNPSRLDKRRIGQLGRDFLVPRLHRKHVLRARETARYMFRRSWIPIGGFGGTQLEV